MTISNQFQVKGSLYPIQIMFYEPYPMGLGGNFLTQRQILERLDRNQFTPIVVSPFEGVALDEFRKMGVECVVIPPSGDIGRYGGEILRTSLFGKLKAIISLLQYNLKISIFIRARQIHVVYANCVRAAMSVGFACKILNRQLFLYVKGELQNPLIDLISFYLSDRVLFMSAYVRDSSYWWIAKCFNGKVDILRGGIDLKEIQNAELRDKSSLYEELCIDNSKINTLVLGQIYFPKGQHLVIEALATLINEHNDICLYIVGDEIIKEHAGYKVFLHTLASQLQVEKHIRFFDWRKDALSIMAIMDIVINPSFSEGFGYVVVEAMALGLPVIASKTGIAPEIIRDGMNGYLVNPGDIGAIKKRWRKLITDHELRVKMGQRAKETAFSECLIDDKLFRLAEIWTEMSKRRD
ncbi:MAG: glycosyltransferase [Desulfobacterales bacterium]|nr:glycosyltransferase [Desulfobacterales bacterium]